MSKPDRLDELMPIAVQSPQLLNDEDRDYMIGIFSDRVAKIDELIKQDKARPLDVQYNNTEKVILRRLKMVAI